ncbi:Uncharacterized protein Adt_18118 [Abeliophyllum distichum]|uniref:Uncharacterized protein n=1 Tax=Abeliophyllum distichum TaxID=126358 RepID=A0ABD1TIF4_9LAMI
MTIRTELMEIDLEKVENEMEIDEDLDLQIIGSNSIDSIAEELEVFPINSSDPTQMLQVGQKLDEGIKEGLKQFLQENTDVFEWKHSDMVRINLSETCHALSGSQSTS